SCRSELKSLYREEIGSRSLASARDRQADLLPPVKNTDPIPRDTTCGRCTRASTSPPSRWSISVLNGRLRNRTPKKTPRHRREYAAAGSEKRATGGATPSRPALRRGRARRLGRGAHRRRGTARRGGVAIRGARVAAVSDLPALPEFAASSVH